VRTWHLDGRVKQTQLTCVVQVALSIEGTVRDSEEHRAEKSECSELHFGNFN